MLFCCCGLWCASLRRGRSERDRYVVSKFKSPEQRQLSEVRQRGPPKAFRASRFGSRVLPSTARLWELWGNFPRVPTVAPPVLLRRSLSYTHREGAGSDVLQNGSVVAAPPLSPGEAAPVTEGRSAPRSALGKRSKPRVKTGCLKPTQHEDFYQVTMRDRGRTGALISEQPMYLSGPPRPVWRAQLGRPRIGSSRFSSQHWYEPEEDGCTSREAGAAVTIDKTRSERTVLDAVSKAPVHRHTGRVVTLNDDASARQAAINLGCHSTIFLEDVSLTATSVRRSERLSRTWTPSSDPELKPPMKPPSVHERHANAKPTVARRETNSVFHVEARRLPQHRGRERPAP